MASEDAKKYASRLITELTDIFLHGLVSDYVIRRMSQEDRDAREKTFDRILEMLRPKFEESFDEAIRIDWVEKELNK